jgi:hypothetical protein
VWGALVVRVHGTHRGVLNRVCPAGGQGGWLGGAGVQEVGAVQLRAGVVGWCSSGGGVLPWDILLPRPGQRPLQALPA